MNNTSLFSFGLRYFSNNVEDIYLKSIKVILEYSLANNGAILLPKESLKI